MTYLVRGEVLCVDLGGRRRRRRTVTSLDVLPLVAAAKRRVRELRAPILDRTALQRDASATSPAKNTRHATRFCPRFFPEEPTTPRLEADCSSAREKGPRRRVEGADVGGRGGTGRGAGGGPPGITLLSWWLPSRTLSPLAFLIIIKISSTEPPRNMWAGGRVN